MGPQSDRISVRTAGQANILSVLGDILTSDGVQALRLPLGTPGQVLTVDLTAECGLSWQPGGGGGGGITDVTGSDGVTVSTPSPGVRNATNDLVTGTVVAQIAATADGDVDINGGNSGTGHVHLTSPGGSVANNLQLTSDGGNMTITMSGNGGNAHLLTVTSLGTGTNGRITLHSASATTINGGTPGFDSTSAIILNATDGDLVFNTIDGGLGGNDIVLSSSLAITANAVGLVAITAGASGNFTVGDAMQVRSTNSDLILDAGFGGGTGQVQVMPTGTPPAVTRTFRIWDGAGSPQGSVDNPTGGAVIDTECRTQLTGLLNFMRDCGWLTSFTP